MPTRPPNDTQLRLSAKEDYSWIEAGALRRHLRQPARAFRRAGRPTVFVKILLAAGGVVAFAISRAQLLAAISDQEGPFLVRLWPDGDVTLGAFVPNKVERPQSAEGEAWAWIWTHTS